MNKFTFTLRSFILNVIVLLLVTACSKKEHPFIPTTNNGFVDSAFQFLQKQLSTEELRQINFSNYTRLEFEGQNRFVEIRYHESNKIALIEKIEGQFLGYINTLEMSDTIGKLICEDLSHSRKTIVSFSNGNVTNIVRNTDGKLNPYAQLYQSNSIIGISTLPAEPVPEYKVLETVYFTGGGSSGGMSYALFSLYYMTNMNNSYYYSYSNSGNLSPKGGGGRVSPKGGSVVNIPIHLSATKPINIAKELECFKNTNGAVYTLRININQPSPNTRDVMNLTADRKVGHTFLTLEQRNPDGSSIIRNVGWYPESSAKPADGAVGGVYQDDSGTPYAVSLTVGITATEFTNVKNYLTTVKTYAVAGSNCTNIGINAFAKAGVKLPQTIGYVYTQTPTYTGAPTSSAIIFQGVNPADLGQDIRGMSANTFSQQNGGRSVIIEKNASNSKSRTKSGTCQ